MLLIHIYRTFWTLRPWTIDRTLFEKHLKFACGAKCFTNWLRRKTILVKHQANFFLDFVFKKHRATNSSKCLSSNVFRRGQTFKHCLTSEMFDKQCWTIHPLKCLCMWKRCIIDRREIMATPWLSLLFSLWLDSSSSSSVISDQWVLRPWSNVQKLFDKRNVWQTMLDHSSVKMSLYVKEMYYWRKRDNGYTLAFDVIFAAVGQLCY